MLSKKRYYSENLKIALPIVLSFAGQSVVQMLDTIMVGHLGKDELGAVAFASAIIINVMVVGIGISISLTPLTGQAFATGAFKKAAGFFQNSLMLNSYTGAILTGILLLLFPFLKYMGQPEEVIVHVESYYIITTVSLIPLLIFLSFKQFMEGIGNTKAAMVITISCNVVNVLLNYILIYGKFGALALGVAGAAIATLIARLIMPIAFFVYMYNTHPFNRFFAFFKKENLSLRLQIYLLKIGSPIAGQMVL
ncbi:MAG: polysaccharide biosynthesis C-terminal domain-containing protein [Rikenellaceae bacterium]|nr:polysaccharide biosynthesis C-terminal domain-containing protein [Rikenellaceae bacterium]